MKTLFTILVSFIICSCQSPTETAIEVMVTDDIVVPIENKNLPNSDSVDANNPLYMVNMYSEKEELMDTLISLEFLESEMYRFNKFIYPEFSHSYYSDSLSILLMNEMKIEIKTADFDSESALLEFDSTNSWLMKINGKEIWGTDGNIPNKRISSIKLIAGSGSEFDFPKESIEDLFEPSLYCNETPEVYCMVNAYYRNENEIILVMLNGDGAGGYTAIFSIKNNSINKRIIGLGF